MTIDDDAELTADDGQPRNDRSGMTTDKQQTTNNKQQNAISARIATEKTKG
jgi:hypothetical protein